MSGLHQILIILFICCQLPASAWVRDTIDISGDWNYVMINLPDSLNPKGLVRLPNTLDNAHLSIYNPPSENTSQLRREYSFTGEVLYETKITIPEKWSNKHLELKLERTKPSTLFIDGNEIGSNLNISSPQIYNLSGLLSPGNHTLELAINNNDSIPPLVAKNSSANSEMSQTNWNGILGRMIIEAKNPLHIEKVIIDDKKPLAPIATVYLSQDPDSLLSLNSYLNGELISTTKLNPDSLSTAIPFNIDASQLWSAINPVMHQLSFSITDKDGNVLDKYDLSTGFRNFTTKGNQFFINGYPVFLRGIVDAAVFPLTGFPPITKEAWLDYFSLLKDYGINHVRFHSWVPPGAAFQAADEVGMYLLVESPLWGEIDKEMVFTNRFLMEDLKSFMSAYAHHPSLVMYSTGNELWGDTSIMGEFMDKAREFNARILATHGSNLYMGIHGQLPGDDFILTSKTSDDIHNSVRGSVSFVDSSTGGFFNSSVPNSTFNFGAATNNISVPVISHEVGQYQSYPDFSQIEKYKGILKPDNLNVFRKKAEQSGLLNFNKEFTEASGKWAAKLYKAEMELAQRSPGIAGFDLFGIKDYPGQGTALVGILDSFLDSKELIDIPSWKASADDVTILAEIPKYVFNPGEPVYINLLESNYSQTADTIKSVDWTLDFASGKIDGKSGFGLINLGEISFRFPEISRPCKYTLKLESENHRVKNAYDLWVFPDKAPEVKNVEVTSDLSLALSLLEKGENVILCPDSALIAKVSLDPLFTPDFFSYKLYHDISREMKMKPSPGTLGLLIRNNHPALAYFPSDSHTDWHWFSIVTNSRPLIIDRMPKDFEPIISVIDNIERSYPLALLMECKVGKGKLIILSADLEKISENPEGRWLLYSLEEYIASKKCDPKITLSDEQVRKLLTMPSQIRKLKELTEF